MRYPRVDERQRQNLFYADRARSVVNALITRNSTTDTEDARAFIGKCEWILQRSGILTELGRILDKANSEPGEPKDEETEEARRLFLRAVGWLGENKPNTKVAIGVLRREGSGGVKPADEEELAHRLASVVRDYGAVRPGVDHEFVVRALSKVPRTVRAILDTR
jgi:hypothetical protein